METTWPCQLSVSSRLQVDANEHYVAVLTDSVFPTAGPANVNYVAVSTDSVFQTAGPGEWKLHSRLN